jgi:hypothetical protein
VFFDQILYELLQGFALLVFREHVSDVAGHRLSLAETYCAFHPIELLAG